MVASQTAARRSATVMDPVTPATSLVWPEKVLTCTLKACPVPAAARAAAVAERPAPPGRPVPWVLTAMLARRTDRSWCSWCRCSAIRNLRTCGNGQVNG